MTAENIVHVAQLGWMDIQNADIGTHAGCHLAGGGAGHARAKNDHFAGTDAGSAAEEDAASAVFRLEAPGAHLNREPAGNFTHGR